MTGWEYLIVALPPFKTATAVQGQSDSVTMLNREGGEGWEGVGMTLLEDGHVAVLDEETTRHGARFSTRVINPSTRWTGARRCREGGSQAGSSWVAGRARMRRACRR